MLLDDENILIDNLDDVTNWPIIICDKYFDDFDNKHIADFINNIDPLNKFIFLAGSYNLLRITSKEVDFTEPETLITFEPLKYNGKVSEILIKFRDISGVLLKNVFNITELEFFDLIYFIKDNLRSKYYISEFNWEYNYIIISPTYKKTLKKSS